MKIDLYNGDSGEITTLNESGRTSEEEQRLLDAEDGEKEFNKSIKQWMKHSKSIEWKKLCPE